MAETVTQLLAERADDDGIAIRHDTGTWSWRAYIADARRVAATVLDAADSSRPMHIGVLLGNTPTMLFAIAAGALGGYVTAGINNTRRGEGLARDIRRADCQILLTDAEHRELLDGLDLGDVQVFDTSTDEWAQRVAAAPELTPHSTPGAVDPFMLIFTSGTSGDPKPVQLAHMLIPFAGPPLVEKFGITADDVCYLSMPLFHSAALLGGYCVAAASGASMVPAKFSASTFLDDVRRFGVTYMNYVGKPLAYILATPERPDDADNPLRAAFGNEATDRDIDDFARRFDCMVWDGYGSSELAVIITREPGTPKGSIGKGFPGVAVYNPSTVTECAVAQFDENGALLNADEAIGEIVNTSGAGMFTGYYNDEATTSERMREGMYWSGDLGYRDADGWIYLAGRTGDWMRVDGENLTAGPIERILQRMPEVGQVAVYGVPDDTVGDAVMAAVVPSGDDTPTPEAFASFLAGQPDLSPKAWPRYVRVSPKLPTTATNKIIKRALKQEGARAHDGEQLWEREPRGTKYIVSG
ncbi:long-chain fatty-acid--CoA ligase FadD17 [Gordonia araii NBRC 100433]|uniref:Long-chain fatty-acid--CoA ligase FadD17 n=1 Tax=Gordonia araii NBRC 100433 TaxID=1073574 RepID=G7H1W8_9ACTN|nr:fatty-acid--CoA ligase FadD1 [Gordonia araii]NNG97176.1 AMP-binding protein [Gordonia araii NBRC 100433]GAB09843.1 long-chain fatty-acid--CoA ligase FadD17 [Gordonia araii NBRC 100433]